MPPSACAQPCAKADPAAQDAPPVRASRHACGHRPSTRRAPTVRPPPEARGPGWCAPSARPACVLSSPNRAISSRRTSSVNQSAPGIGAGRWNCAGMIGCAFAAACLRRGDDVVVRHPVQHPVAPRPRRIGKSKRIVVVRRLGQGGQKRRLGQRELVERLVEIGLRRGGDAVRLQAEIDLVQIESRARAAWSAPGRCASPASPPGPCAPGTPRCCPAACSWRPAG